MGAATLCLFVASHAALALGSHPPKPPHPAPGSVLVDWDKLGQKFEGLGALSGGGGTSRLLFDYPEPQRSDVLDALFNPSGGGALHILKTEIGGDAQSTEATEPSHMHTRRDENYNRGYEWWLMKEAKARNPAIKLYALSWGAPGWIGDGNFFSEDNIEYHLKWLKGAQTVHGLTLDYMGIWNEHAASTDWIVRFRAALDDAGFGSVKIVATDEGGWPACDAMVANRTVRDAIDVVGSHYPIQGTQNKGDPSRPFRQAGPTPASCQLLNEQYNKSLWTSEGWNLAYVNDWAGGLNLGSTINRNFVLQNQTAMVVWNLVYSWYSILPYARPDGTTVGGMGHGLMSATEPWSGHYRLQPPLYAMMHTTQFTEPGTCRYLAAAGITSNSGGVVQSGGWLDAANQSTLVAFQCGDRAPSPDVNWVTLVVETSGMTAPLENLVIQFRNFPGWFFTGTYHVWRTCESAMFEDLGQIPIHGPDKHDIYLNVTFLPACIYTLINRDTRGTTIPSKPIPPSRPFPVKWSDNFDEYADQQTVKYFTDEAGSFNAAKPPLAPGGENSNGMVLQQAVPLHPINGRWWGNSEPYSLIGNSQTWSDLTVAVDALIPKPLAGGNGPPVPRDGYLPNKGALVSGHDVNSANMTWADAVVRCDQTIACQGFTFESTEDRPTAPVHVYLKSTAESNADGDWRAWVKAPATGTMPAPHFARVCSRISRFEPNGSPPMGLCLILDSNGMWFLAAGGKIGPGRDIPTVLATGQLPGGAASWVGRWHRLRLDAVGTVVTGSVDGKVVGIVQQPNGTFTHGMAAIGCGWHVAYFDNFVVNATTGG